jgi:hypothetical protein
MELIGIIDVARFLCAFIAQGILVYLMIDAMKAEQASTKR